MSHPTQNTAPHEVQVHRSPEDTSDRIAFEFVKLLRFVADRAFADMLKRGERPVGAGQIRAAE